MDLRKFGVAPVKFKTYNGELGDCAKWWREHQLALTDLRVPHTAWLQVTQSALEGPALKLFRAKRAQLSSEDVSTLMGHLVALFDKDRERKAVKLEHDLQQQDGFVLCPLSRSDG